MNAVEYSPIYVGDESPDSISQIHDYPPLNDHHSIIHNNLDTELSKGTLFAGNNEKIVNNIERV